MSVSDMRNASMHPIKLAVVLLCALGAGNAAFAQSAQPAPAAPAIGGFTPPGQSSNQEIDSIAVVVNDDVITRRELNERVQTVITQAHEAAAGAAAVGGRPAAPDPGTHDRRTGPDAAGQGNGHPRRRRLLDRAIARIAEQQKMNLQQMRNQMEKEGTSFASFREEIREEIIMQRLREHEVDSKIQISEAEVDSFLAAQEAAAPSSSS
jgi:peptidyl-prolyl cis-trans isomerase SurA